MMRIISKKENRYISGHWACTQYSITAQYNESHYYYLIYSNRTVLFSTVNSIDKVDITLNCVAPLDPNNIDESVDRVKRLAVLI